MISRAAYQHDVKKSGELKSKMDFDCNEIKVEIINEI